MRRKRKIKIETSTTTEQEVLKDEPVKLEAETNAEPETNTSNVTNVGESESEGNNNDTSSATDSYKTDLADIDAIIKGQKENKEEKRGRKSKDEKARQAILIPGTLFVRVHNYVASGAIGLLESYISKDNPVPRELVSMDEKMIQELAPLAELAMKEMKIEENPIAAFYISFGSIMVSNYMSVKSLIKQAVKQNPEFDAAQLLKK